MLTFLSPHLSTYKDLRCEKIDSSSKNCSPTCTPPAPYARPLRTQGCAVSDRLTAGDVHSPAEPVAAAFAGDSGGLCSSGLPSCRAALSSPRPRCH